MSPACPDGEACYGTQRAFVCLRPGTPLSTPPDGLYPALCPPDSTAVLPELDTNCEDDELCCAPWCDLTVQSNCADGTTCHPWFEEGMTWDAGNGVCLDAP